MTISIVDESQRTAARIAGLAFPISFATVVAVNFGIFTRLIVRGNPAETARNILAHETLFRIGVAGDMVYCGLLRNHPDRPQPRLHQLRPSRYRKLRAPQPKRMPALRVQMHLHGNPSLLQRNVVSQRVVYVVHVVILRLQQKRRRRLAGDRNIGIQRKIFIGIRRMRTTNFLAPCLASHSAAESDRWPG